MHNKIFIDSGAHGLYSKFSMHEEKSKKYDFYNSSDFLEYVDKYALFVKQYEKYIYYANVDVIFNPELTFEIQKYIEEKHQIKPIPVVHYGADIAWIEKYINEGHTYIGIGGLGQEVNSREYSYWADEVFRFLKKHKEIKTHGFAITALRLLKRYNWYSVDSTSYYKVSAYGGIYVPISIDNFTKGAEIIKVSQKAMEKNTPNHYDGFTKGIQEQIRKFESIANISIDSLKNDWHKRVKWNVIYFMELQKRVNCIIYLSRVDYLDWATDETNFLYSYLNLSQHKSIGAGDNKSIKNFQELIKRRQNENQ